MSFNGVDLSLASRSDFDMGLAGLGVLACIRVPSDKLIGGWRIAKKHGGFVDIWCKFRGLAKQECT